MQRSRAGEHLEFKTMRDSMRLKAASRGEWGELKGRAAQGHRLVTRGCTGPHFRPRGHGGPLQGIWVERKAHWVCVRSASLTATSE